MVHPVYPEACYGAKPIAPIAMHFAVNASYDRVLLSTNGPGFSIGGTNKLALKRVSPFEIAECSGSAAYRLNLPGPITMQIDDIFCFSLLTRYHRDKRACVAPHLSADIIDDESDWEVEFILDQRLVKRGHKNAIAYLINVLGQCPPHVEDFAQVQLLTLSGHKLCT